MFRFTNPARFLSKLLSFTESLDREIPAKALDKNLVLGTWNIRDLNEKGRLDESYAYISEVVSRYDILAVQELKTSLTPIDRLKEHLGTHWEYVVSHPCMTPKGNYERMAFIYDTRRVKFSGVSSYVTNFGKRGEIGLEEFSRSPYMAGFSVGDFKFFLCNVHLYYDSGRSKSEFRRKEIKYLMEQLEKGSLKSKYGFTDNFIILGDLNIPSQSSSSYSELLKHSFKGFSSFLLPTAQRKTLYDQVMYLSNNAIFGSARHGRVPIFNYVFDDNEEKMYAKEVSKTKMDYSQWRTFQMSDHDPLWIEMKVEPRSNYWKSIIKIENIEDSSHDKSHTTNDDNATKEKSKMPTKLFAVATSHDDISRNDFDKGNFSITREEDARSLPQVASSSIVSSMLLFGGSHLSVDDVHRPQKRQKVDKSTKQTDKKSKKRKAL